MANDDGWEVREARFGSSTLRYRAKGDGPALLVLPHDNGYGPNGDFLDSLASSWRVYAPWLPGFHNGGPGAWDWIRDTTDLALVISSVIRDLGLVDVTVLGLGYGGWVAAEMACARPDAFRQLLLVAPAGIRPTAEPIYDQFLVGTGHYAERAFHDPEKFRALYGDEIPFEQLESWETDREMLGRIGWKPYMYNPSLEHLLPAISVPVVLAHGDDDRIIPRECSERYAAALPNARLEKLENCGHAAEFEQPGQLISLLDSVRPQAAG